MEKTFTVVAEEVVRNIYTVIAGSAEAARESVLNGKEDTADYCNTSFEVLSVTENED